MRVVRARETTCAEDDLLRPVYGRSERCLVVEIAMHPLNLLQERALDLIQESRILVSSGNPPDFVAALQEVEGRILPYAARGADHQDHLALAVSRKGACAHRDQAGRRRRRLQDEGAARARRWLLLCAAGASLHPRGPVQWRRTAARSTAP